MVCTIDVNVKPYRTPQCSPEECQDWSRDGGGSGDHDANLPTQAVLFGRNKKSC
ncbi:hypothetical protein I79_020747 [Cricetulus griseus]|uniref:Uncharacterized protein n=1 Tax=Cricetulus griseus TaxID=10029 RepID=G3IAW5_CRIGR|nr:hypothetical protein I79_020747 [Cricetulus griseus]